MTTWWDEDTKAAVGFFVLLVVIGMWVWVLS